MNRMMPSLRIVFFIISFAFINAGAVVYSYLPDTLWIKTTFYDFHQNSNFGTGNCGTSKGLVQDTLDRERKPVLKANNCYNDQVAKWFRPSGGTGAVFAPFAGVWSGLNNYLARGNEYIGKSFNSSDPFANVVIYDSLPFQLKDSATGTYQFIRTNQMNGSFFWLDNKGFGKDGLDHNYNFTMELHREFLYQGGETFSFRGDDDVWVFINGILALDLGGMQSETRRTISLDQMANQLKITKGNNYVIDFFFSERHSPQSDCEIMTNILTPAKPRDIIIKTDATPVDPKNLPPVISNLTVKAGDTLNLWAHVLDDTGSMRADWDTNIIWQVVDVNNNPIDLTAWRNNTGSIPLTEAYGSVKVYLMFQHPEYANVVLRDTITVYVSPGPADHIVIEGSADSTISLRNDNPLGSVTIGSNDSTAYAYAVLRDKYGNWVSASKATNWSSTTPGIITVVPSNQTLGQGLITKVYHGQTYAVAQNTVTPTLTKSKDSVLVIVNQFIADTLYDSIRICSRTGTSTVQIDSLVIGVGEDTTLVVQGHRKDGSGWAEINGTWTASTGLRTSVFPPFASATWNFMPLLMGRYSAGVSYVNRYSANLKVIIVPGAPSKMTLYPSEGTPDIGNNTPYPSLPIALSATSGLPMKFVVKVFDAYGNWISDYETVSSKSSLISWITTNSSSGISDLTLGLLLPDIGNPTQFTPKKAYTTADICASLQFGQLILRDTVRLTIAPGSGDHIVLESDTNWRVSPNTDNPIDTVRLSPRRTQVPVYLVIRDTYGNFVGFSQSNTWSATDTLVATATVGLSNYGQGLLTKGTATGITVINGTANSSQLRDSTDDIIVISQDYWYDTLRIAVKDSVPVNNVIMTTADDTLLTVLGHRDDGNGWEIVPANWSIVDPVLNSALSAAPSNSAHWMLSPITIATGRIRISLGDDGYTLPDTATITINAAPPTRLSFFIVTPPEQRRAGDTIKAVVEIRNGDGLIPGTYCYPSQSTTDSALYQDAIGSGNKPDPKVITSEGSAILSQTGATGAKTAECFSNGIDTVYFILYYAPQSPDSLHQLQLTLGNISAITDPFKLYAGAVDSLVLTHPGYDTALYSGDSIVVNAVGYDKYGNKVDQMVLNWSTSGNLLPFNLRDSTSNSLSYVAPGTQIDRSGKIVGCVGSVCSNIGIVIIGGVQTVSNAAAFDANGNGFIDKIDIVLSRPSSFTGYTLSNIKISYNGMAFTVASIEGDVSVSKTTWSFNLTEKPGAAAQTSWKPDIRLTNSTIIYDSLMVCADSAGPVIWQARFYPSSFGAGTAPRDTFRVQISEGIRCENLVSQKPSDVFRLYEKGIGFRPEVLNNASFVNLTCNSTYVTDVVFTIPSGVYEIIPGIDSLQLTGNVLDIAGNYPPSPAIARKAPVMTGGENKITSAVGPNPFIPGVTLLSNVLGPKTVAYYKDVIGGNRSGVLLAISSQKPLKEIGNETYGKVTIYDAVGNVVQDSANLKRANTNSFRDYGIIWNGTNKNGRVVGNGAYLAVVKTVDIDNKPYIVKIKIGVTR